MDEQFEQKILLESDYVMKMLGIDKISNLLRMCETCALNENEDYFEVNNV